MGISKFGSMRRKALCQLTGAVLLAAIGSALWGVREVGAQPPDHEMVTKLIAELKGGDEQQQLAAAQALIKLPDVRSVEPLLEVMRTSNNKAVTFYSARALNAISDPRAFEPLMKHFKLGDNNALAALGRLKDRRAVEPLLTAINATNPNEPAGYWTDESRRRRAAISALGMIGDPRAVGPILKLVDDESVRESVFEAVKVIGDQSAVAPLIAILQRHADRNVRILAIFALEGFDDSRVVPALEGALQDRDEHVRSRASGALKGFKEKTTRSIRQPAQGRSENLEKLIRELKEGDWPARGRAALEIGKLNDARAAAPLFECLKDAEKQGKIEWKRISAALLQIKDPQAAETYIAELRDGNKVAAQAMRNFPGGASVEALIAVLRDPKFEGVYQFYWEAAESLGALKDSRAVPGLIAALNDNTEVVRFNAAKPLGPIGDRRAVEPLIDVLKKDPAYGVRLQAAISLGELDDRRAVEPLIKALQHDEHPYVRLQAATALGKISGANAEKVLSAALSDKDPQVREAVRKALAEIDSRPPAPVSAELTSDPADGASDVSAGVTSVKISFPGDMQTESYTVAAAQGGVIPEPVGTEPYTFRDARTFVMQVRLAPDTAYAFSLNTAKRKGFKTADGTPLPPRVIRFRTMPARTGDRPEPAAGTDLVVSKEPRGLRGSEFRTINEAIQNAKPWARIVVYPGIYKESIVLDRKVHLVAKEEEREPVIVESAEGACVLMKAEQATVKGFVLRGRAATVNKRYFAVDVPQGELLLEDCDITSDTMNSVCVYGGKTKATIRRCRIHDGAQGGILFTHNAGGLIEECDISGNAMGGLEISNVANPQVRKCKIHDGKQGGVYVHSNGRGTIEGCEIFGNGLAGVQLMSGATTAVIKCVIRDGLQGGVLVNEKGEGVVEDCDIFGNKLGNFEVTTGGNPVVRRTKLHDGKSAGIYAHKKGLGTFEDCDVYANTWCGVAVESESGPVLRKCKIYDSKQSGAFVYDKGNGKFEECTFYGNTLAGMEVKSGAHPLVTGCTFRDGKANAIRIVEKGEGTFKNCNVSGNESSGVLIGTGGKPILEQCKIHNGKQGGIFVLDQGEGVIDDCDIFDNALAGVEVRAGGDPVVRKCRIYNGTQGGVFVYGKGKGTFEACEIYGNKLAGVEIGAEGNPVIRKCIIRDGKSSGVVVRENGKGTVEDCSISGNAQQQVLALPGSEPTLRNNKVTEAANSVPPPGPDGFFPAAAGEKEAVAFVQKLGGQVEVDHRLPNNPVTEVDFTSAKTVTDTALARMKEFPALKALRLGGTEVTDVGLAHLKGNKSLLAIDLRGTRVTDVGMSHLRTVAWLQEIDLEDTAVGDAGLAQLAGLTRLRSLVLNGTRVTDAGMKHIGGMSRLLHLRLNGTSVTDAGLVFIKDLVLVEELYLTGTNVTDAGLINLEKMKLLQDLDLSFTKVGNVGLKRISTFANLESLGLVETPITDAGLPGLYGMVNLKKLNINLTAVTEAGFARLKQALPQTVIVYTPAGRELLSRPGSIAPAKLTFMMPAGKDQVTAAKTRVSAIPGTVSGSALARELSSTDGRAMAVEDFHDDKNLVEGLAGLGPGWGSSFNDKPLSAGNDRGILSRPGAGPARQPQDGSVRRVVFSNPIAGFSVTIPDDWEMATGSGRNIEIAIDANPGTGLRGQPALWFFYSPNAPEQEAKMLARDLRILGASDAQARSTVNRDEWEVTASANRPPMGRYETRWLCRRERGMNYVIGAVAQADVAARFSDDIDTALRTCRLVSHPVLHFFREPTENAYSITLPQDWRWQGKVIRTLSIPGYFEWKAQSPDGLSGCFTAPPGVFNMWQDYFSARDAARGVILEGLRKQIGDVRLERVDVLNRASDHLASGLRLLGFNPRLEKARADYRATVNGVDIRIRVDIVSVMQDVSRSIDPRLAGRGNWVLYSSGAWAPVARFDEQFAIARGVQVSHRTNPRWVEAQRYTVGKVLAERHSVMDEAYAGWDAYIRDMERIPDPDGGPIQEVPNRDGGVWKDPDGIMHRVPPEPDLEQSLRNRGWRQIR